MNIGVKLDTNAVRAMFPEGTKAYADLQQSVINNIVRERVYKDADDAIKKAIDEQIKLATARVPDVKELVNETVESFFERKGWSGYVKTKMDLDSQMNSAAKRLADNIINTRVNEFVEDAMKRINYRLEEVIKMNTHRFDTVLAARLNSSFGEIMDKAIAAKLAEVFPVEAKV